MLGLARSDHNVRKANKWATRQYHRGTCLMEESEAKRYEPGQKESNTQKLTALEQEAGHLKTSGKVRAALEKLEEAIKLDKKWYHFRCKAQWKLETGDYDGAEQAINDGLEYCDPNQFWLLYFRAEFLFRIRFKIDQAKNDLLRVERILFDESSPIEIDYLNVPNWLRWPAMVELHGTTRTNLKMALVSLRSEMESMRQSLILFNEITAMKKNVELEREKVRSERVSTIELLGVFAAILAFIFSGVHILTKFSLIEALLLQAGMALSLTIFFLGIHLVIFPEARKKLLITIFVILTVVFFLLPFYARALGRSDNQIQRATPAESEPNEVGKHISDPAISTSHQ